MSEQQITDLIARVEALEQWRASFRRLDGETIACLSDGVKLETEKTSQLTMTEPALSELQPLSPT